MNLLLTDFSINSRSGTIYMRAHELNEIAMNPTAYAQSIEQAEKQKVLVGFEFEVCIPKEIIEEFENSENNKFDQIGSIINDLKFMSYFEDMANAVDHDADVRLADKLFKIKSDKCKFLNFKTGLNEYLKARVDKVNEYFKSTINPALNKDQLAKKEMKLLIADSDRSWYKDYPKEKRQYAIFCNLAFNLKRNAMYGDMFREYHEYLTNILYGKNYSIINYMFEIDSPDFYDNLTNYLTFNPNSVIESLELNVNDGNTGMYYSGAKLLQLKVQETMNATANIFTDYHQENKNMTDWYIEPDGSIEPNNDDGAAEIVGPPEPAKKALDSLSKFYKMAKELNLYTNESTGLHVNVSIPKNLDIAKLAFIVGDQYVLELFNRMNNYYAVSVSKSFNDTPSDEYTKLKKMPGKNVLGQKKKYTDIKLNALQRLASNVTYDHTASVSFNGKYVSFRHAGGDYLNKPSDVINTVGRFIRAMVIASDPNAYKQDYMKAIAKLAHKDQTSTDTLSVIDQIQRNGLPALEFSILRKNKNLNIPSLRFGIGRSYSHTQIDFGYSPNFRVIKNSERAKQNLLKRATVPSFKKEFNDAPIEKFTSIFFLPKSIEEVQYFLNIDLQPGESGDDNIDPLFNGYNPVGWDVADKLILPLDHPETKNFIMKIRKDSFKKNGKK